MTNLCSDPMCNQDRERKMVTVVSDQAGKPLVWCDPCIAPIVAALNAAGITTTWSCCGHGHRPACIGLKNGRQIVIARDAGELRRINELFPVDINGESAAAMTDKAFDAAVVAYQRNNPGQHAPNTSALQAAITAWEGVDRL
jgi:hypothetical protein